MRDSNPRFTPGPDGDAGIRDAHARGPDALPTMDAKTALMGAGIVVAGLVGAEATMDREMPKGEPEKTTHESFMAERPQPKEPTVRIKENSSDGTPEAQIEAIRAEIKAIDTSSAAAGELTDSK